MIRRAIVLLALGTGIELAGASAARAWGIRTHVAINRRAAEAAGEACGGFFRRHAEELARRAPEPDTILKARLGEREQIRHFIDLDSYPEGGVPEDYRVAVERYGRERVRRNGILPWRIDQLAAELARELKRGDEAAAVEDAAYLGHYIGDATMPLHTTRNFDGQLTHQTGVHARIERELIDGRFASYERELAAAVIAPPPWPRASRARRAVTFALLMASARQVPALLRADRTAASVDRRHGRRYLERFESLAGASLRVQLIAAAEAVAASWRAACPPP
jgi:hypothetical protein